MQPGTKRVASASSRQQQGASPARSGTTTAAETIPEHEEKSRDTPYSSSPVPPGHHDDSHPAAPLSSSSSHPHGGDYDSLATGGAGLNYVSSSDSSSPLSETYRPANECRAISANAATAAAASVTAATIASRKHSLSQKMCFKQVQFHLNNIALSAPLLKKKFSVNNRLCTAATAVAAAATTNNNTTASSTATSTQARLLNQIPILRSVRKTRKKRKKVKPSEAARAEAHQKDVLTNLPPSKAFLYTCLNKNSAAPDPKNIVYNGTYPIDQPFCSRFKNCSFSLSSTDTDLDSAREFEARIRQIQAEATADHLLRKRSTGGGNYVKTFAIDEPI